MNQQQITEETKTPTEGLAACVTPYAGTPAVLEERPFSESGKSCGIPDPHVQSPELWDS